MQTVRFTVHCKRRRPLWPNGDELVRSLAYDQLFEADAQVDEDLTLHFKVKTTLSHTEAAQRLSSALTRRYDNIHSLQVYHGDKLIQ